MTAARTRWGLLLVGPFAISLALLVGSQLVFLKASVFADLGFGRMSSGVDLSNYVRILTDSYYVRTLWLTCYISLLVALCCIVAGFPIAQVLARLRSRWTTVLLSIIVLTSFITIVIQVFGLIIIFRADGPVNRALMAIGLIDQPFSLIGTVGGVVVGLIYSSFGFTVMLMFAVVRTIPVSLDEAAAVHGASRLRVFLRVILPLSLPGIIIGFLTVFNLCMGAFTSAALLGGGRIITLPVLIQRTMLLDVKYGMAGALAAVLLVFVIMVNLLSVALLKRFRASRLVVS
jgi:putative spermidine/putrescine transport system permease protein